MSNNDFANYNLENASAFYYTFKRKSGNIFYITAYFNDIKRTDEINITKGAAREKFIKTFLKDVEALTGLEFGKKEFAKILAEFNQFAGQALAAIEQKNSDENNQNQEKSGGDHVHAVRLLPKILNKYRWSTHSGSWYRWNGIKWEEMVTAEMARIATELLLEEYNDELDKAIMINSDADQAKWRVAIEYVSKFYRVLSILEYVKTYDGIKTTEKDWDQQPNIINLQNGLLNLDTKEFIPHATDGPHKYLCLKAMNVSYDPNAKCEAWLKHLEYFLPNPNIRRQVQRELGKALSGFVENKKLMIWLGTGANAKTTTANFIQYLFGDYATTAARDLLVNPNSNSQAYAIADLYGARMVFANETDLGKSLSEGLTKALTGGDKLKGRFPYRDYFEFFPTFTLLMITNYLPNIKGQDPGIWRRILLIPWTISIQPDKIRPQWEIMDEFKTEAAGILNWLLEGYDDYKRDEKWVAPEIIEAIQEYRSDQDILAEFFENECEFGPDYVVTFSSLYDRYKRWCEIKKEECLSKQNFILALHGCSEKYNITTVKIYGERGRKGLRLKNNSPASANVLRKQMEDFTNIV